MTIPIVTELPLVLEPVTADSFLEPISPVAASHAAAAAGKPRPTAGVA
jgi:hypothetical protein